jgi:hypothetical protein
MILQKAITPSYFKEQPELCALGAMVVGNEQWLGQTADDSSPIHWRMHYNKVKQRIILFVYRFLEYSTRKRDAQYTDTCQMTSGLIQKENKQMQCMVIQMRSVLAILSLPSFAILHLYQHWTVIGTSHVS